MAVIIYKGVELIIMWQKIKNFFNPLTAREQEEEYLKINGYPKKTVVFADRNGRLSQLTGSDIIIKVYEDFNKAGYFSAQKELKK